MLIIPCWSIDLPSYYTWLRTNDFHSFHIQASIVWSVRAAGPKKAWLHVVLSGLCSTSACQDNLKQKRLQFICSGFVKSKGSSRFDELPSSLLVPGSMIPILSGSRCSVIKKFFRCSRSRSSSLLSQDTRSAKIKRGSRGQRKWIGERLQFFWLGGWIFEGQVSMPSTRLHYF